MSIKTTRLENSATHCLREHLSFLLSHSSDTLHDLFLDVCHFYLKKNNNKSKIRKLELKLSAYATTLQCDVIWMLQCLKKFRMLKV